MICKITTKSAIMQKHWKAICEFSCMCKIYILILRCKIYTVIEFLFNFSKQTRINKKFYPSPFTF